MSMEFGSKSQESFRFIGKRVASAFNTPVSGTLLLKSGWNGIEQLTEVDKDFNSGILCFKIL